MPPINEAVSVPDLEYPDFKGIGISAVDAAFAKKWMRISRSAKTSQDQDDELYYVYFILTGDDSDATLVSPLETPVMFELGWHWGRKTASEAAVAFAKALQYVKGHS